MLVPTLQIIVCRLLRKFLFEFSLVLAFVRSCNDFPDDSDSDTHDSSDSGQYNEVVEDIGDELERRHILVVSGGGSAPGQELAQIQVNSCITLSFDLGASSTCIPEDIGLPHSLQEHLLACPTSSPVAAYIYYLGFLEHIFHATSRILGRLKEESGSANGALELWQAEMANSRSGRDLQRTIVRAHTNAIRVCLLAFLLKTHSSSLTIFKGGSSRVPRACYEGRGRRCSGEYGLSCLSEARHRSTHISSSCEMARSPGIYPCLPRRRFSCRRDYRR